MALSPRAVVYSLIAMLASACVGRASLSFEHEDFRSANATRGSRFYFSDFSSRVDADTFFGGVYQRDTFIDLRGGEVDAFTPLLREVTAPLGDVASLCDAFEKQPKQSGGFMAKKRGETRQIESCEHMREELDNGAGLLIRFEDLADSPADQSTRRLQDGVREVFGTESTVHLYHATQNDSRALMPHTDPYDVLVIQLQGSKRWTQCVPNAYATEEGRKEEEDKEKQGGVHGNQQRQEDQQAGHSHQPNDKSTLRLTSHHLSETETIERFNDAQLGQLQEIRRQKQQGCTAYQDEHLRGMKCEEFTLHAGDTMYMPKGIIHFALAGEEGSSHLTISLERRGLSWADALVFAAEKGAAITHNPTFLAHWRQAIQALTGSYKGVPYLEAMPSWHLHAEDNRLCADSSSEERAQLVATFQDICWDMVPHVQDAYESDNDLEAVFNQNGVAALTERVCSEDAAQAVVGELCAQGRLPVDVTSSKFRKGAFRQNERSRRATVTPSYTCDSGCDGSCDTSSCTTSCDDSCDTDCDTGRVCDSSCDGSCNDVSCTYSCDGSCDYSCDVPCSCDTSCEGCCDLIGFGCDCECDSSCDSSCSCDGCDSSCDDCEYHSCDSGCDGSCSYTSGCDNSCNTNCGESCDYTECDSGCDSSCYCHAGYAGDAPSCSSCDSGKYSASNGQTSCSTCNGCSPGEYRTGCGGSNPGTCVSCPSCPPGQEIRNCGGLSPGNCHATDDDDAQCLFGSDCGATYSTCGGQRVCCPADCSDSNIQCVNGAPVCTCSSCARTTTTTPQHVTTRHATTAHDDGQCLYDGDCSDASSTSTCGGRTICCDANCGSQSLSCFNGRPTCNCSDCSTNTGDNSGSAGCTRQVDNGEITKPASNADQELFIGVALGILGGVWLIAQAVALARNKWCAGADDDDIKDDDKCDSHEPWLLAKLTALGGVKDSSGAYMHVVSYLIKTHELLPLCVAGEELRVRCDLVQAMELMFDYLLSLAFSVVFASLNNGTVTTKEECRSGSVVTTSTTSSSSGFNKDVDFEASVIVSALGLVQTLPYNALCKATKPREVIGRVIFGGVVVAILILAFVLAARDSIEVGLYFLVLIVSKGTTWFVMGPFWALVKWCTLVLALPKCFGAWVNHDHSASDEQPPLPHSNGVLVENPLSFNDFATFEESEELEHSELPYGHHETVSV